MSAIVKQNPHTHELRGNADMNKPKKQFQFGNTTVIIHSPLIVMSEPERKQWFQDEWEKGNPILRDIADRVHDCYRN
ncbi:hypothetical protein [Metabacillus fastidiosus]|uniref:hypothetical protein n=1 Tax=Metabacillus fastidiosus TaxID=1458 RepID=UPI003D2A7A5B